MDRCIVLGGTLALAMTGIFGAPSSGAAQDRIVESKVSSFPIGPARQVAYEPCSWTERDRTRMCLRDRLNLIYEFLEADFDGENGECRFVFAGERLPLRVRCGELRVAVPTGSLTPYLNRIALVSGGEWAEETDSQWWTIRTLRVKPGSERSALFSIIFYPDILWADFNRVTDPVRVEEGRESETKPRP